MRGYWKAGVAYGEKCYTAEWEILQRPGPPPFSFPISNPAILRNDCATATPVEPVGIFLVRGALGLSYSGGGKYFFLNLHGASGYRHWEKNAGQGIFIIKYFS